MEYRITAPTTKVTVYPDRAGITCAGEVDLEPGSHRIIIPELPLYLERDSARIKGKGTAQVRLHGVDIGETMSDEPPAAEEQARAREIHKEIETLQDQLTALNDEKLIVDSQLEFIRGLRQSTELYAKGLARGKVKVGDQAELLNFMRERDTALRQELRRNSDSQREHQRKIEKLRHEVKEVIASRKNYPNQRYYQAEVDLDAVTAGKFTLELTFITGQAGWSPLYDLRLTRSEGEYDLEITMLAEISQRTELNWNGVELTVSTARPALNQRMPKLKPWYLRVPPPPRELPAGAMRKSMVMPAAAAGGGDGEELYSLEDVSEFDDGIPDIDEDNALDSLSAAVSEFEAQEEGAVVNSSGLAVTYTVPGATDITGDGTARKLLVNRFNVQPELEHITIPIHTDAVFRRVKAVNEGPGPLPAGKSSLFLEEEYIGPSRMKDSPSGDKLRILFGVEERIKVKRDIVRRETDKTFIKDDRQLKYAYEIKIENLLPDPAKILVKDQLPVSRSEDVKIRDEKFVPEPDKRTELNLLEWRLELESGGKEAIRQDFTVRHPRSLNVMGLPD